MQSKHKQIVHHKFVADENMHNKRLDTVLSEVLPQYSRSRIQTWIKSDCIQVNKSIINKNRHKLCLHDEIILEAVLLPLADNLPQQISLDIIYEDDHIIVLNKPVGMVVHPGAGNPDNTLVNGLLYHRPTLNKIPRAGIIHRLDKNTSGIMLVTKTLTAHNYLVEALQKREITRIYHALVYTTVKQSNTIEAPIGRHPKKRQQMAVTANGKFAKTSFSILKRFLGCTLLKVSLSTGRTHQIRVHMHHIGHPIVGDQVYTRRKKASRKTIPEIISTALRSFPRQALHAHTLSFKHPVSQQEMTYSTPPPEDFTNLCMLLEKESKQT